MKIPDFQLEPHLELLYSQKKTSHSEKNVKKPQSSEKWQYAKYLMCQKPILLEEGTKEKARILIAISIDKEQRVYNDQRELLKYLNSVKESMGEPLFGAHSKLSHALVEMNSEGLIHYFSCKHCGKGKRSGDCDSRCPIIVYEDFIKTSKEPNLIPLKRKKYRTLILLSAEGELAARTILGLSLQRYPEFYDLIEFKRKVLKNVTEVELEFFGRKKLDKLFVKQMEQMLNSFEKECFLEEYYHLWLKLRECITIA